MRKEILEVIRSNCKNTGCLCGRWLFHLIYTLLHKCFGAVAAGWQPLAAGWQTLAAGLRPLAGNRVAGSAVAGAAACDRSLLLSVWAV
jgi:hypothetical protein